MDDYQREQFDAYRLVRQYLKKLTGGQIRKFHTKIREYMKFREDVDGFINRWFRDECTAACFAGNKSACCSKEGIVTFFADVYINALFSGDREMETISNRLQRGNTGFKCIYLGEAGCIWRVKPIVCQMFLCNAAREAVFEKAPAAADLWDRLKQREKTFTWPDRPVLFDDIEAAFLAEGLSSPLMYLHNSPGLLRVKRLAGMAASDGAQRRGR